MDRPLRFQPFLRPMVWGGDRLGAMLGKPINRDIPHGESWEISDHPSHRSVALTRPWTGQTLRELMERSASALLGPGAQSHPVFPWLIKFLDAHDWLSVQVHPDEAAVQQLWPGEGSKTEAWYVLSADPGSRIYAGLQPGVDYLAFQRAIDSGHVLECLHSFPPKPGDCVFLPAGTVHAVGGGVLIAEIQQTSDATFRLFDWNRRDAQGQSRTLHIEQGLASIHWDFGPVGPVRANGVASPGSKAVRQTLVRCAYFELEHVHSGSQWEFPIESRLHALMMLKGTLRLSTRQSEDIVSRGDVLLLPASLDSVRCLPLSPVEALICTLP